MAPLRVKASSNSKALLFSVAKRSASYVVCFVAERSPFWLDTRHGVVALIVVGLRQASPSSLSKAASRRRGSAVTSKPATGSSSVGRGRGGVGVGVSVGTALLLAGAARGGGG